MKSFFAEQPFFVSDETIRKHAKASRACMWFDRRIQGRLSGCAAVMLAFVLGVVLGWAGVATAQEGGGIVTGHVADQSGAVVRNADVTLVSTERNTAIVLKTNGEAAIPLRVFLLVSTTFWSVHRAFNRSAAKASRFKWMPISRWTSG